MERTLYTLHAADQRTWHAAVCGGRHLATSNELRPFPGLDWIEQGLTSPPTQYRLSGRQFYRWKVIVNVLSACAFTRIVSFEVTQHADSCLTLQTVDLQIILGCLWQPVSGNFFGKSFAGSGCILFNQHVNSWQLELLLTFIYVLFYSIFMIFSGFCCLLSTGHHHMESTSIITIRHATCIPEHHYLMELPMIHDTLHNHNISQKM